MITLIFRVRAAKKVYSPFYIVNKVKTNIITTIITIIVSVIINNLFNH